MFAPIALLFVPHVTKSVVQTAQFPVKSVEFSYVKGALKSVSSVIDHFAIRALIYLKKLAPPAKTVFKIFY